MKDQYCKTPGHYSHNCYCWFGKEGAAFGRNFVSNDQKIIGKPEVDLELTNPVSRDRIWRTGSGGSQHITSDKKSITNYLTFESMVRVKLVDDSTLDSYENGKCINLFLIALRRSIISEWCYFCTKTTKKLFSLSLVIENDAIVKFKEKTCGATIHDKK